MDNPGGLWISPWTTRGFPPQKPPNRRAQPPLFHRLPPIPPWISRFSTIPFPWKSLFVHSAPPSPPPSVSHKAHRFPRPAMAVENRKFCIIAPFSPDFRRIAAPVGRPVWITPPNSPVCSRFSKAHRNWESRNFLPPPPWICAFFMIYRAMFPVNTGQPVDKSHFSTVSPPLLRLRLRIFLFSLYIRRLTAARLRFETKSGSFSGAPGNACGAQIGGWGWVHFRKCRKAGAGCILFTKCSCVCIVTGTCPDCPILMTCSRLYSVRQVRSTDPRGFGYTCGFGLLSGPVPIALGHFWTCPACFTCSWLIPFVLL